MAKSKFFRVFVEGDTVDGRNIDRQDIIDMADTYNPATYGARVNLEHMRGMLADGPFQSLGDVIALRAQEDDMQIGGKTEKRMALYAQIEPLPQLLEINKKRQKIYTSVEIMPNFAKTGKAGLIGLAITDSPASLGTEVLAFAAKNPNLNPFASRKTAPENLFSAGREIELEFEDDTDAPSNHQSEATGAFAAMKEFFKGLTSGEPKADPEILAETIKLTATVEQPDTNAALFTNGLEHLATAMEYGFAGFAAEQKKQADEFAALKADLDKAPDIQKHKSRPEVSGGNGRVQTDC